MADISAPLQVPDQKVQSRAAAPSGGTEWTRAGAFFDRLNSIYGVSAALLFAVPLLMGLITHIAPLQIGSRGVALPRLGALAYWFYEGTSSTLPPISILPAALNTAAYSAAAAALATAAALPIAFLVERHRSAASMTMERSTYIVRTIGRVLNHFARNADLAGGASFTAIPSDFCRVSSARRSSSVTRAARI